MKREYRGGAATPKPYNKNDKLIIPQKEKNYIDTLFLYTNLEEHYMGEDASSLGENYKWLLVRNDYYRKLENKLEKLSDAKGYEWWRTPKYRIGIMDYDKAKRLNRPNCIIQYEHSHLFNQDMQLSELDLPFLQNRELYKFKRIDITKTAILDTDYTVNHGYISPWRGDPLNPVRVGETSLTVYLGSRKNGNVFRMYNKTIELISSDNIDKMKAYEEYFGTIEKLYTFEHELHRKYLKEDLGVDTLDELSKVWKASQNIVSQIRIFKMNDKNIKLINQRHRDRIKALVLTQYVEYERPEKKRYKRSYNALVDRIKKDIGRYQESKEWEEYYKEDSNGELLFYMQLIVDIVGDVAGGKDIAIDIEDSIRKEQYEEMLEKYQYMHKFNTKELHDEAELRMKKYPFKKPEMA